jgi:antitoxin component YwqK of YwqJK toxin-antitoxin module
VNIRKKSLVLLGVAGAVLLGSLLLRHFSRTPPQPVREVPANELVQHDGRSFWKNETVPFTGFIVESYSDGSRKSRSELANGVMHGVSEGWYTNGVLQVREHFREGLSDGRRQKWFPSGAKMSEATVGAGKLQGAFKRWHENGALAEEIQMKDGNPDGVSMSYHPDGSLKAKAVLQDGKVIEQKFWKAGELKNSLTTASNQSRHGI